MDLKASSTYCDFVFLLILYLVFAQLDENEKKPEKDKEDAADAEPEKVTEEPSNRLKYAWKLKIIPE